VSKVLGVVRQRRMCMVLFGLVVSFGAIQPHVAFAQDSKSENPDADRYVLPPESIERLFETDKNYTTLNYMSPDGDHFVVPSITELSTLDLMSRKTYRLAELELRPQTDRLWHLDTYGIYGLRFYSLSKKRFTDVSLPEGSFVSDLTWSPDGARIAFLAHLPSGTEVWVADPSTGRAESLGSERVLATIGTSARGQGTQPSNMLQWTPEGTVVTLVVPSDRGPESPRNPIPSGPVVRRTRAEPTPTPTYPNLLRDAHDEFLFEYYTRSQLAEFVKGEPARLIGDPAMFESISVSPGGGHILATVIERPFSFRTAYRGFPRRTFIMDKQGTVLATLDERPLQEGRNSPNSNRGAEPRAFAWRPDDTGLSFLVREGEDDEEASNEGEDSARLDRVMLLTAPFDMDQAQVVAETEDRINSVTYTVDGNGVFGSISKDEKTGLAYWDLGGPPRFLRMLVDFHETDDPIEQPGGLWAARTGNGLSFALLSSDRSATYVKGDGFREDFRPRPFVDRVNLADGSSKRVFESSADSFEQPLVGLDRDLNRMIVSRESATEFPDSYLWEKDGSTANLTNNVDPFPAVTSARRIDFDFVRRDGVEVQGRVSLPIGYVEGQKVPAIFWTYPREYEEAEGYEFATIRARNRKAFTHMSWLRWSNIWLTQGYALVYPDIPIIGENYNDSYIAHLVDAMYGAIRAVDGLGVIDIDRIGHGGHSYGAFATANILAHSPYFKAGIAGDGAYNRSLTPAGFQAERRSIWEAPSTYIEMSPFFKADQMNTPLLMYHGGDDNNTGTFPVQSERMIQALTTLGKPAVLYVYPYESHTPRAIENKLDMWARFISWFDEHVKNAGAESEVTSEEDGEGSHEG
jgi:dipeptidyl aminopeptidase/acylaminoacyl peptidase